MSEVGQSEPAYKVLAAELRSHIAQGRYKGGVRLPTESELSQEYGLSRQTVRRAFLELVTEGSVYRVPGRGTFATENAGQYLRQLGSIDDLMNLSTDTEMQVLESPSRRVDLEAAGRLRLDTDVVYGVKRELIVSFVERDPGPTPDGGSSDVPWLEAEYDFVLQEASA